MTQKYEVVNLVSSKVISRGRPASCPLASSHTTQCWIGLSASLHCHQSRKPVSNCSNSWYIGHYQSNRLPLPPLILGDPPSRFRIMLFPLPQYQLLINRIVCNKNVTQWAENKSNWKYVCFICMLEAGLWVKIHCPTTLIEHLCLPVPHLQTAQLGRPFPFVQAQLSSVEDSTLSP